MPYFQVSIHGYEIEVLCEDIDSGSNNMGGPIIGFDTTRAVWARTESGAKEAAEKLIEGEWTSGEYEGLNKSSRLTVEIEEIFRITFIKGLLFKNSGCTFYTNDEDEDEA